MREYLFVSQMPKSYCRVLMGSVKRALKIAAKYSGTTGHDYMQMHYVFGSVRIPGEVSFYGIVRK